MESSLAFYIVGGAILLVIVLVVWVRNSIAKQNALRKQLFEELGFYEIPEDDDLKQKVAGLRHHWNEKNRIQNIFHRSEWGYKLFVFDIKEHSGESTKTSQYVALMESQGYQVPRFTLLPKAEGDGIIAALANRALKWVTSRFAHQVTFPNHSEFDTSRSLFGDDENALRSCFTEHRLSQLVRLPSIQMDGNGNTLLFQQFIFEMVKQTEREKINFIMETARSLNDIFRQD